MKLPNLNPINAIYLSWDEGNCVMQFANVHLLLTEFEVSTDLPLLGLGNVQVQVDFTWTSEYKPGSVQYIQTRDGWPRFR